MFKFLIPSPSIAFGWVFEDWDKCTVHRMKFPAGNRRSRYLRHVKNNIVNIMSVSASDSNSYDIAGSFTSLLKSSPNVNKATEMPGSPE